MSRLHPATTSLPATSTRSDESWVFTAVAVLVFAAIALAAGGYQYIKASRQQAQSEQERQTYERYNDYLRSTQQPDRVTQPENRPEELTETPVQSTAESPASPSPTTATMAQKLLAHPAVIPGPGFHAPGVQQTGVAIIEAIDHVQSKASANR